MPYSILYNDQLSLVESIFFGVVTTEEVREDMEQSHFLAVEHQTTGYLTDFTDAIVQVPMIDIYELPREYEALGGEPNISVAMIQPRDRASLRALEFFEKLGLSRGWNVQAFATRRQATEWLLPLLSPPT